MSIALICVGFGAVVQLENYLFYVTDEPADRFWFLICFPFLHLENMLVGIVLGIGYGVSAKWVGRAYLILPVLCNALVVMDQRVYKIFRDHMRLSQMEQSVFDLGALQKLLLSVSAELDLVFVFNIGLLLVSSVVMFKSQGLDLPTKPTALVAGFVVYAVVSSVVVWKSETHHLHEYPLIRVWQMPQHQAPEHSGWTLPTAGLYRPRFGTDRDDSVVARQLGEIKSGIFKRDKRPHVVFVVLESVGALQLLKEGRPKTDLAPFLHSLSQRAVTFDTVYGLFPSTTRMHVPLMTGGRTITWGLVSDELVHQYTGPTLIGQIDALGYATAMFSAQDIQFESMDAFYAQLPYDKMVYYGDGSQTMLPEQEVHAWGVWEEAMVEPALAWVDSSLAEDTPFFLHLNTVSTHYPYGTGPEHKGPMEGDDRKAGYYNALHYTDSILENVRDSLAARDILDHTIFVITGDHGQAFSEIHDGNLTHRNFLYDENVRTFLMIADPRVEESVVSHRVGMVGDIMGTLVPMLGGETGEIPGRDLLSEDFNLQITFFHKSAHPELWGLRDGQWKYVAKHNGNDAELYDLSADPTEQKNLADDYPERLEIYRDLCAEWFVSANYDYIRHLDNFELVGETGLKKEELGYPGPKIMTFVIEDRNGRPIDLKAHLHPEQPFTIWTRWVAYQKDKTIRYEIVPPDKPAYNFDFIVDAEWDVTWVDPQVVDRMGEGQWLVRLFDADSLLLTQLFEVNSDVPLVGVGALEMSFGPLAGEDFVDLSVMHPDQAFVIWNTWAPYLGEKTVRYKFTAPQNQVYWFDFSIESGWERTWFNPKFEKGMAKGVWNVSVLDGEDVLIQDQFEVALEAQLYGTGSDIKNP